MFYSDYRLFDCTLQPMYYTFKLPFAQPFLLAMRFTVASKTIHSAVTALNKRCPSAVTAVTAVAYNSCKGKKFYKNNTKLILSLYVY